MSNEKISITLVKSLIGRPESQKKIAAALGLTKTNKTVSHSKSPVIMGMVEKVKHLISVQ